MEDADSGTKVEQERKRKSRPLWVRFVHFSIRRARKRKAEKQPESAADKAARRTADATIVIAVLTLVLAVVSYFQWREIHGGSTDTHNLAEAAGTQATWTQNLAANMQTQADRTKDLADRMRDQADRTKTIADQAVIQAEAAQGSVDVAKQTLQISERAYLAIGRPRLDETKRAINIPIQNTGRIPSGTVDIVEHELTVDTPEPTSGPVTSAPTEHHWAKHHLESVSAMVPMEITVPIPSLNSDRLHHGMEKIVVAGSLLYNDGFPNTSIRLSFCAETVYHLVVKDLLLTPCDPSSNLLQMERIDKYTQPNQPN